MEKIDWDKAPEGATHFYPGSEEENTRPVFWRVASGVAREVWIMDGSMEFLRDHFVYGPDGCHSYRESECIPRPSPSWSGEGLPPVGSACELSKPVLLAVIEESREFPAGTIVEIGGHAQFRSSIVPVCVIRADSTHFTGTVTSGVLRPIRTPEQIAEDEREAAIAEIVSVINSVRFDLLDKAFSPETATLSYAAALYAAGLRVVK